MTQKHFDAIIAKNNIAEVIRQIEKGEFESISELPMQALEFDLATIEEYIGTGNQPSVDEVIHELT